MERFDKLRKEWIVTLKILKPLSTQTLYILLEPDDDNKFFECIDSFKDCIEETQFIDFQMRAIEYLLEYKKQSGSKIKQNQIQYRRKMNPLVDVLVVSFLMAMICVVTMRILVL